jgi:hypothetical protein
MDDEVEEREDPEEREDHNSADDDEPFEQGESHYDSSMYAKFSSSYKFSLSDLQDLKRAGQETPETELSVPDHLEDFEGPI